MTVEEEYIENETLTPNFRKESIQTTRDLEYRFESEKETEHNGSYMVYQ